MPVQIEQTSFGIESTYKAREVEGFFDLHFYRPIGFWLAQFFAKLRMTPTAVTILGGLFGIVAGHLYFYRDLRVNAAGMALHVFANTLDNADGQLARLTDQRSRQGRIVDSLADHFVFLSIYVHLTLRYLVAGAPLAVCFLALAAGISHALQGAAADYYRNAYLYFVNGRSRANFDSSAALRSSYRELDWRCQPWSKFLLAVYWNYTRQQEMLMPRLSSLRDAGERLFSHEIPLWLRTDYRASAEPALRWWRLLMTNARMLILFFVLLISQPIWYFWAELIPFNLLFIYLILRQEKMSRSFLRELTTRSNLT
jgi:phosphatidylglycerophosphate synthase